MSFCSEGLALKSIIEMTSKSPWMFISWFEVTESFFRSDCIRMERFVLLSVEGSMIRNGKFKYFSGFVVLLRRMSF